jgi:hypothetical protein
MLQMKVGFEIEFNCPAPTPMLLALHVHSSRTDDLLQPEQLHSYPQIPIHTYHDLFGNRCARIVAPAGSLVLHNDAWIRDSGLTDAYAPWAM